VYMGDSPRIEDEKHNAMETHDKNRTLPARIRLVLM